MSETTFENAKIGDRVYSPLYACKNQGDKTNAVVKEINVGTYALLVVPDITDTASIESWSFTFSGKFIPGGGQMLFWENPINSIPTRPKRKVTKKIYDWIRIAKEVEFEVEE